MTAFTLFVIGWAAWGCIVNVPAWARLLRQSPTNQRVLWMRRGMVLQSLGVGFGFFIRASSIWTTGALPVLVLFGLNLDPASTIIWTTLSALAQICFIWVSHLPAEPDLPHAQWPWRAYLVGTALWALLVLGWSL